MFALTTVDNPYDPFEDFDNWFRFDCDQGYYSCAYLARIAKVSSSMSDSEYNFEMERAIDEIIKINKEIGFDVYKKVKSAA